MKPPFLARHPLVFFALLTVTVALGHLGVFTGLSFVAVREPVHMASFAKTIHFPIDGCLSIIGLPIPKPERIHPLRRDAISKIGPLFIGEHFLEALPLRELSDSRHFPRKLRICYPAPSMNASRCAQCHFYGISIPERLLGED